MQYLYLSLTALLISGVAAAQKNFQPGYVITLNGDSIPGFIDYREWSINPKSILFKTQLNDAGQTNYEPGAIKRFAVTNHEYYESYQVKISQNKTQETAGLSGLDTSYIVNTVFLRALVKGHNLNLYSYYDFKSHFYIGEASSTPPAELIYRVYNDQAEANHIIFQKKFANQLTALASKYGAYSPKLANAINKSDYSEPDLVKIVNTINGSNDGTYTKSDKKSGANFYLGVGAGDYTLNYKGQIALSVVTGTNVAPQINFGINFYPNKNVGRLILQTNFSLAATSYNFLIPGYKIVSYTVLPVAYKFNMLTATFEPTVIYNYYNVPGKLRLYVGAGLGLNISAYSNENYTTAPPNITPQTYDDYPPAYSSVWFTVLGKLGVTINNKFDFFAGYHAQSPITSNAVTVYTGYLTSYQVGVNYIFGVK